MTGEERFEGAEEEQEVEVVEVEMGVDEIDEFILKLDDLKENKGQASFEIADDMELLINYKECEGGDENNAE